ncbi:Biotin carboxyl carrier protein [Bacillus cereus Rock4-18]|nr:Biotin carboxyl carrier protein [Bacillus cereus Rock4-18]
MLSILPSYVFLLIINIILLLTCPISSQLRLKNQIEENSMKDI